MQSSGHRPAAYAGPTPARSMLERALVGYARHAPLNKGKLRLVNALWRLAVGDRERVRIAKLIYGQFEMQCDLNEMLQRQFYFFGTYFVEELHLRCWQTAARRAQIIADIGANAGIYSLAALASQPRAEVHAFEPTPEIAAHLRGTVALNNLDNHLFVHEMAVSNSNGSANLVRCRGDLGTNEGMNFLSAGSVSGGSETVEAVSLDKFCHDHAIERLDLVKMDIQGHEHAALIGAQRMIESGRIGDIFMELNWADETSGPCPATRSVQLLGAAGYRFSEIKHQLDWRPAGEWLRAHGDLIASRDWESRRA